MVLAIQTFLATCLAAARRQRSAMGDDIAHLRNLPAVVAKACAGTPWTLDDRRQASEVGRSLARVCGWCVVLVMPGGFFLVPLVGGYVGRR